MTGIGDVLNKLNFNELLFYLKLSMRPKSVRYSNAIGNTTMQDIFNDSSSTTDIIISAIAVLGFKDYDEVDVADVSMALYDLGYLKFDGKRKGFFYHSESEALEALKGGYSGSIFVFKNLGRVKCPYKIELKKKKVKCSRITFRKKKNSAVYRIEKRSHGLT